MKYVCILGSFICLITGCASEVTVLGPPSGAGGAGSTTGSGNVESSASSESTSAAGLTAGSTSTSTTSGPPSVDDAAILCTAVCELLHNCEVSRFAECMDGCVPDLSDCSVTQLDEIEGCIDRVEQCSGIESFFDCANTVTCTDA